MVLTAEREVDGARTAAQCVVRVHELLADHLRAGLTLADIDTFVADTLTNMKSKSAFHRYRLRGFPPFPSQSCLSVNDCIVHGTHHMTTQPLQQGDLISIDIGVSLNGWIGDAAWTYAIEFATDEAQRLMAAGRESLARGIETMQAGARLLDWAKAVQHCVEDDYGLHLVRGLGGHGYGRKLHGPPFISNVQPTSATEWPDAVKRFQPGLLVAVEPMLATGTGETRTQPRKWPIFTADGSLAVHYEADILITEDGPENLTAGIELMPDIVG